MELDGSVLETPHGIQVFCVIGNRQAPAAVDEQRVRNVGDSLCSELEENASHKLLDFIFGHFCNLPAGNDWHLAVTADYSENVRRREDRSLFGKSYWASGDSFVLSAA
jgi:hypothetical protein